MNIIKSKAAVLYEIGLDKPYKISKPLKIQEVDIYPPGPEEVLVQIKAAGLCHSDLSVINGNRPRPVPMAIGVPSPVQADFGLKLNIILSLNHIEFVISLNK